MILIYIERIGGNINESNSVHKIRSPRRSSTERDRKTYS
ncbi:hypothetical protein BACI71_10253 [Bacillus mycoides]|uniref:Uncharacterized protein n=1 Tax=Bacillus mycoides TaxID=1405 RepID=A0A653MCM9_BACMY|nr:hypothetical protein BACI71_10253 [Bacillus mycoides]